MWGGMYPGESFVSVIKKIADGVGVKELMDSVKNSSWHSLPMNLVLADE